MASSFCGSWSHPLIAITLSRTLDEVVTQSANWERDPPAVFARRLSVGLVMLDAVSLVNSNCLAVDMWGVKGTNAVSGSTTTHPILPLPCCLLRIHQSHFTLSAMRAS
ncbi:hypothetical protein AB1Y20_001930 [Prymnesium parvum]|uniref:Uncharacterized protein n=1 Tax=Prymnesium parvum TaxID=97485 RepID=A0AB34J9N2_PRYPA